MERKSELPIGTPIIYYNFWTGFETADFRGQFVNLEPDEIKNLKEGDIVYVDIDPLHPHGKVYGMVKAKVVKVEPCGEDQFRIFYAAGRWNGYITVSNGLNHQLQRAKDERVLEAIVAQRPRCKQIDFEGSPFA